ncbi:MAG: dTDP-4-dehydrorhamnose 3,5-epimerase family protein, partial [Pontibacter sp.]|nr:dTDP-4-dehydrorhamnose 3,5-epimerase family protein [Pontibacter sp.]
MIFTETQLTGAYSIDVKRLEDERGFFGRSYCEKEFEEYGLNTNIVQANVSYNKKKGTLRG